MPEHLQRRRNTWFVRLAVPTHLRAAMKGRRELIRTTKTHDLVVASRLKHRIIDELQSQLNAARLNRELSPESADYVLAAAREARDAVTKGAPEGDAERGLDATIEKHLDLLREKHGEDRMTGDPNITDGHARAIQLAHRVFAGEEVALLSTRSETYLTEKAKKLRKQTVRDKRRTIEDFRKWLGRDVEVTAVTRKTAARYIEEVLLKRDVKPKTTLDTLSNLSALWTWLHGRGDTEVNGVAATNPWAGLGSTVTESTRGTRGPRRPWTDDELVKLLKSFDKTDPLFALSVLEIYTGARREEVCQFRTEHVQGDALIIGEGKTSAAVRTVPIHPVIRPLVARLAKQTNDGFLIPGLLTGGADDKRGHYIGKRFGHHIRSVGFTDKALVGHTLRNSFIHRCEQAGIPETTAKLLVGHSRKSSLTYGDKSGGYSPGLNTPELAKAVAKVTFGPLDAYVKGAAGKVKVDANKSHRRSERDH
jgi:site-specific recombinase XerD